MIRARRVVAGALLLCAGLAANLPAVLADRQLLADRGSDLDLVTMEAQQFVPLVSSLPVSGTIGYLQPDQWPEEGAGRRFYLAQYSLTPRLLVLGTGAEYVIAVPEASAKELPGFALFKSFDNGIRIFRRIP